MCYRVTAQAKNLMPITLTLQVKCMAGMGGSEKGVLMAADAHYLQNGADALVGRGYALAKLS